ncbi:MAG: hypothetical protein LJE84_06180 [Gammaproteobacteria bacterium]|nr:hypothetical protein [Gammaproteobacteria bacterium]
MNAAFLPLIAIVLFLLGLRFVGGLLDRAILPPGPSPRGDPAAAWLFRSASLSGGTTVLGVAVAVGFGWVPGFLWVLCGSLLGGAVMGAVASRLGLGRELGRAMGGLLGDRYQVFFGAIGSVVLLGLSAVLLLLVAQLLASHPAIAIAFLLQMPLAWLATRWLSGAWWRTLAVAGGVSLLLFLAVWAGGYLPVAFSGTVDIRAGSTRLVTLDASLLWMMLLMVYLGVSLAMPASALGRARGVLAGMQLVVLVVALLAAVLLFAPPVLAPQFYAPAGNPGELPWLFVLVSGGAVAGFHAWIALANGAQPGTRMSYSVHLFDGLLGVLVVVACTAGFAGLEDWQSIYAEWPAPDEIGRALEIFLFGAASLVGDWAPAELVTALCAFILASLSLTTLEAALRGLAAIYASTPGGAAPDSVPRHIMPPLLVALAVVVLAGGEGRGGLWLWPVWLPVNQAAAALFFLATAAWLRREGRPLVSVVLAPGLFLGGVSLWALIREAISQWQAGDFLLFTLCAAGASLVLGILAEAGLAIRRSRQQP